MVRLLVALAYLAAWVAVLAAAGEPTEGEALAAWAGLGLGAGLLIGRWWAVGLALGYALIAVVADVAAACVTGAGGPEVCDADVVGLVLLVELPAMALTLALGVAARKVLRLTLRPVG